MTTLTVSIRRQQSCLCHGPKSFLDMYFRDFEAESVRVSLDINVAYPSVARSVYHEYNSSLQGIFDLLFCFSRHPTHSMRFFFLDTNLGIIRCYFLQTNQTFATFTDLASPHCRWVPIHFLGNSNNIERLAAISLNQLLSWLEFLFDRKHFCLMLLLCRELSL
jgi:hypothetical protein